MLSDLRFAFRQLAKSPGFTFVAILALALGVATATSMFTFYNALLVRPIPFLADESSLVYIRTYNAREPSADFDSSVPDFRDIRRESSTLSGALTVWNRTYILGGSERPERVLGNWITADAFQTLGVRPTLGRVFHPDEGRPGAEPVVLLGHALWKRSYGGNPDLVGQTVTLNNETVTVIGVMPEGFAFPETTQLWQPFPDNEMSREEERGSHGFPIYARMKPGVDLGQVQAELDTFAARFETAYPKTNAGMRFRALLVREEAVREEKLLLQLGLGAVLAVLLIACGNVANLLLARSAARSRELAVRAALGAGRGRLIRQMLTESLILGLAGGLIGLILTFWQIDFVLSLIPVEIPFWIRFDLDWRVLAFSVAATLGSSLLFGAIPALQLSRPDLAQELKDGGRCCTDSGDARRFRGYLVILQLALTLVLLVVAGLMTRSFLHLQHADPGFDPRGVFTFRTGIPPTIEKDEKVAQKFFETALDRLREIPGVEDAAFVSYLPLTNSSNYNSFIIEGRPEPAPGQLPHALYRAASPGAFSTLRIPLRRGRLFDERDRDDRERVVVVSEAFVAKFFPQEDPLGRRLIYGHDLSDKLRQTVTIVGVVGNILQRPTAREPDPAVWLPLAQKPDNFMSAVVRVKGDPASYRALAEDALVAARPGIPLYVPGALTKIASDNMWTQRFFGCLFLLFAGVALFLASLGIYGVMAYSVAQRTQEIGVRMALGAPPRTVVTMVIGQGLRLVLAGLALGFVLSWFGVHLLASLLHGVEPHDPPTFALVPLLLALVALLACYLPTRRATRIDPLAALRSE